MPAKVESFLPEDYLVKRMQRRTNVVCLTLFVLVVGGVIGAVMMADTEWAKEVARASEVNAKTQEAARRLDQLDELQQRKQEMIRKAQITSMLLERVPRSILLAELINNMPDTLSLLEFSLETKVVQNRPVARTALDQAKAKAQQASLNNAELELKNTEVYLQLVGVAPTDVQVAQFMTSLGRAELFGDVNLSFSEEVKMDDKMLRKFRIEMRLNENIDVREYEPKMVRRDPKMNPMSDKVTINPEGLPARTSAVPVND